MSVYNIAKRKSKRAWIRILTQSRLTFVQENRQPSFASNTKMISSLLLTIPGFSIKSMVILLCISYYLTCRYEQFSLFFFFSVALSLSLFLKC